MNVAQSVRLEREQHPERFCTKCLWRVHTRTGYSPCPRHPMPNVAQSIAEQETPPMIPHAAEASPLLSPLLSMTQIDELRAAATQFGSLVDADALLLLNHIEALTDAYNRLLNQPSNADVAVTELSLLEAYGRCGKAHAAVMELEDARQALKPDVIKRLVETGAATSASAAEKLVEKDEQYMTHRRAQYEAEIERWSALGEVERAKLQARLASGGAP